MPSKFPGIAAFPVSVIAVIVVFNSEEYSQMDKIQKGISTVLFLLLAIVLSYLCYYLAYGKSADRFKKRMACIEEKGLLPLVEENFVSGVRLFDGNLIVGKEFMFGRQTGLVLIYDEIDLAYRSKDITVYQSGRPTEIKCQIMVRASRKKYKLCSITESPQHVEEWNNLSNFLKLKCQIISIDPNMEVHKHVVEQIYVDDD